MSKLQDSDFEMCSSQDEVDNLEDLGEMPESEYEYRVLISGYLNKKEVYVYVIDTYDSLSEAKKCFEYFRSIETIKTIVNKDPKFRIPEEVSKLEVSLTSVAVDLNFELEIENKEFIVKEN